jgi:FAD/FMN-containing dehydrogenase
MPDIAAIRRRVAGDVIGSSEPRFATQLEGMLFNQVRPDRRPDVIVRAVDEDDVAAAVRCARDQGLRVTARGGGHSWAGLAVRAGGMLIDLAQLTDITVDPDGRTASIQPSVSNRDLMRHLSPHGLPFPVGHCPTVKASGFLLSGGIGWNSAQWGLACESVQAVDLVTARGERVRADAGQNTDLFWAARGAGAGLFAVATRYHLRLHPMPRAIRTSAYYYPADLVEHVGPWLDTVADDLPAYVELSVFLMSAPPEIAARCASANGKVVLVTATAFADDPEDAAAALSPLESCPVMDRCVDKSVDEPTPFETLFDASGAKWPPGHRYQVETLWTTRPSPDLLLALRDHLLRAPSAKSLVLLAIYPGWTNFRPRDDLAFSMAARTYGGLWTTWESVADDAANLAWHQEAARTLEPFMTGHYLGETDIADEPSRAARSFAPAHWRRLQAVRERHDPDGIFHGFTGGLGRG